MTTGTPSPGTGAGRRFSSPPRATPRSLVFYEENAGADSQMLKSVSLPESARDIVDRVEIAGAAPWLNVALNEQGDTSSGHDKGVLISVRVDFDKARLEEGRALSSSLNVLFSHPDFDKLEVPVKVVPKPFGYYTVPTALLLSGDSLTEGALAVRSNDPSSEFRVVSASGSLVKEPLETTGWQKGEILIPLSLGERGDASCAVLLSPSALTRALSRKSRR